MIQITLEAARVNAGYTQDAAAELLNVTKQTIINWEKSRTLPSVTQARDIERVYGIPLDYIRFPKNQI